MGKYSTFQFSGFDRASDADNYFDSVKSVTLALGVEGNAVEECAKVDCSDGECCDGIERGWYRDRAVVGVIELEGFVVNNFSEQLCSDLIYGISDVPFSGDTEAEFLNVVDGVCCCLGTFGGLFVFVVASGTVVVVIVVLSVVVTRGLGKVVLIVGLDHWRISLGGG